MNDPDSMANFRRLTTTPVETLPATLQSLETKQMRAQSPMYEQRKSLFFNKQTTREISEEDKLASMAKRRRLTLTRGTERTKKMRGLWKKVRSEFISVGKFSTLHNMVNKRRYGIDIRADFKVKEKVTGIARLILIPNKGFQKVWGIIICLLLFYTITFLPFQVTFYSDVSSTTLIYLDYTIQSFFGVDIILNFFTAYYDQYERLVTDFRKISWHYMKTWFIFDVLATFPTQLVIDDIWKKPSYNQFVRLARIPRMLRLLSAMRFIKAIKMISLVRYRATLSHVAFVLRMNAVLKRTLILLFVLLLMTHIFACIWYFEARTNTLEDRFWTDVGHINEMTTFDAYIRSLSWSVQTVTSLGMGNIVPINLAERIITMFWMALGNIFFAIFTGNVQITAESESKSLQSIKARSAIFEEFATQSELPIELSRRVNAWIAFKYKDMKQMTFLNEMDFIDELPDFFRQKILLHLSSMLMELFPFLNEQPKEMIVKYGRKFIIHRFLPGEDVFLDKGHAEEVFFVSSGRLVRLNQSGMVISSYVSGDILGAREVINKQRRVTSAKSKVFSVVFRIDQDTFRAIIREYPETARFINDVQSKRLKMEYSNQQKANQGGARKSLIGLSAGTADSLRLITCAGYRDSLLSVQETAWKARFLEFTNQGIGKMTKQQNVTHTLKRHMLLFRVKNRFKRRLDGIRHYRREMKSKTVTKNAIANVRQFCEKTEEMYSGAEILMNRIQSVLIKVQRTEALIQGLGKKYSAIQNKFFFVMDDFHLARMNSARLQSFSEINHTKNVSNIKDNDT